MTASRITTDVSSRDWQAEARTDAGCQGEGGGASESMEQLVRLTEERARLRSELAQSRAENALLSEERRQLQAELARSRQGTSRVLLAELGREADCASVPTVAGGAVRAATLQQCERDHILNALNVTHWVVGGPRGAAALLDVKRTTLISKMQKLGITRPD